MYNNDEIFSYLRTFEEKNDAYVINTCTVTGESDRKSRQMLHRARKENPKAVVVAVDVDRVAVPLHRIGGYGIYADQRGRYVMARRGDLVGRLARTVGVSTRRLCQLNDIADRGEALTEGTKIYVE